MPTATLPLPRPISLNLPEQNVFAVTKEMREAGIRKVLAKNWNESYVCEVDPGKICLPDFQRALDKRHAAVLKAKFYRRAVRNPVLALLETDREGNKTADPTLYVPDGQHQTFMLLNLFDNLCDSDRLTYITADVHFGKKWAAKTKDSDGGIEYQGAAELFGCLNRLPKRNTLWSTLNALIKGGQFEANTIWRIVHDEVKLTTPLHGVKDPDVTSAVVLYDAYKKGPKFLKRFLLVLRHAWTDAESGRVYEKAKQCQFLRGLIAFMDLYQNKYNDDKAADLIRVLKRPENTPANVHKIALEEQGACAGSRADAKQVREALEIAFALRPRTNMQQRGVPKYKPKVA